MARTATARKPAPKSKPSPISPRVVEGGKRTARAASRFDAWENTSTGLGGTNDKSRHNAIRACAPMSYATLSALFHGDDMAYTIASLLPKHALRQGVGFTRKAEKPTKVPLKKPAPPPMPGAAPGAPPAKPGQLRKDALPGDEPDETRPNTSRDPDAGDPGDTQEAQDQAKQLRKEMVRLQVFQKTFEAASYGRGFGGGALILGLEGKPESPAKEDAAELKFITVVDRSELKPCEWYEDPLAAKFGEPKIYAITPKGAGGQVKTNRIQYKIHESRMIVFGGAHTTREMKANNEGWDLSVIQRVYAVLQDVNTVLSSTAYMVSDVSQSVLKTPGLIAAMADKGLETIQERILTLDRTRSVARTLLLDSEEEFSHQERGALSFLADTIDRFFLRLAAAANMPVAILMGQAPAGLNATGAIDLRWWYDQVKAYETQTLEPALVRLAQVISRGLFKGLDPECWEIEWPPLWQMTPEEESAFRKTIAETDAIYIDKGVVMAEEVTQTRWGSGKFNPGDYQIDLEARAESLRLEAEAAMAMPDPNADPAAGDDELESAGGPKPGGIVKPTVKPGVKQKPAGDAE